ncbi:hypothetical protein ACVILH_006631 [Bradyrhizobium sp. USDA 4353]
MATPGPQGNPLAPLFQGFLGSISPPNRSGPTKGPHCVSQDSVIRISS